MKEYLIKNEYFVKYKAAMDALSKLRNSDRAKDDFSFWSGIVEAEAILSDLLLYDDTCITVRTEKELEK